MDRAEVGQRLVRDEKSSYQENDGCSGKNGADDRRPVRDAVLGEGAPTGDATPDFNPLNRPAEAARFCFAFLEHFLALKHIV